MIFPVAKDARKISRSITLIHDEISSIERAVLESSEAGLLSIELSNSYMTTPGTDEAREYYLVWAGHKMNEVLTDQMNEVMRNFKDRGYSITRKTNNSTLNTFVWVVRW